MAYQEVLLKFSRKELAQEFLDWVEKVLAEEGDLPWFDTSETMMVMSMINREASEISFTGLSAGVEEEDQPSSNTSS